MKIAVAPVPSPAINLAQEALETAAQTRTEAANGDHQAIQKLARLNEQKTSTEVPPSAPEGNVPDSAGTIVNAKA